MKPNKPWWANFNIDLAMLLGLCFLLLCLMVAVLLIPFRVHVN